MNSGCATIAAMANERTVLALISPPLHNEIGLADPSVYTVQYKVQVAEGRQQLSRERILGAAAELAGRDGLESLSMRRLAQELDVWPMSVYRYFRDKDELVDAVAAEVTRGAMKALGAGT